MTDTVIDHSGIPRCLGYLPPPDAGANKLMRANRTNIQELRAMMLPDEPTVYTLAQLKDIVAKSPIDYADNTPADLIEDQGSWGACTFASATGAGRRQAYLRGIVRPRLSWAWGYDQINGGQDNGSVITDSLRVVQTTGVPEYDRYKTPTFRSGVQVGGKYWKEDVAITLATALECATALTMGILPQVPIMVERTFEDFTNGIAWGGRAPRSQYGNHSIYLAGIRPVGNDLYFVLVNSWRASWGPFGNGTCLIPFAGVDNCADLDDGYGHASTPEAL